MEEGNQIQNNIKILAHDILFISHCNVLSKINVEHDEEYKLTFARNPKLITHRKKFGSLLFRFKDIAMKISIK